MGDTNSHDDEPVRQTDHVATRDVETSRRSFLTAVSASVAIPATGLDGSDTADRVDEQGGPSPIQTDGDSDQDGDTANSVSQYGITWEFEDERPVGQYANGDWWVEGPVTITKITPESTEENGRVKHGTMINPVGGTQGFDSYDSDMAYDSELNVDPGTTGEPLTVEEGSVVSSISLESPNDQGRPVLSDLAILTAVSEQPPADAFRPGPYSEDTSAQWTESDLDYGVLRSLPMLDSAPDLDAVTESVERFWNEQETSWTQRTVHAANNQPAYGRGIAYTLGDALLSLHLDYSDEAKRDLFVNMVQRGIDIYGRASMGGVWEDNCGHNPGRKMPMLFAGLALGDRNIRDMARAEGSREAFRFQEDRQTFFVSEADLNNSEHPTPYTEADLGMPEWGCQYTRDDGDSANRAWDASYRWIGSSFMHHGLTAHVMDGAVEDWNHPAFFDYLDRYVENGSPSSNGTNGIQPFAQAFWNEYRYVDREPIDETVTIGPDGATEFSPADLDIEPGTTVGFEWESGAHTVTVDSQPDAADWSGVDARTFAGATHNYTFEIAGTYEYYSQSNHGEMQGRITVGSPSDGSEEPLSIPEAIDADDNGEIDDQEILTAVDYWHDNETVPGTDGQTIDQETLLNLIESWQRKGS